MLKSFTSQETSDVKILFSSFNQRWFPSNISISVFLTDQSYVSSNIDADLLESNRDIVIRVVWLIFFSDFNFLLQNSE